MQAGYTNSAWGLSPAMLQGRDGGFPGDRFYRYSKQHLVPFGEFIPPTFRWFTDLMNIPLGDFARGDLVQPGWNWAGQRVAPNICYEDLFGEELAASFRDPATAPTVMVNLSNIGWFGDTVAIDQHLQISRLRALELGRPMLRARPTPAPRRPSTTRGVVTHRLPRLTRDRLEASVQGRTGLTPYATWASRWGQGPVWLLSLAVVGVGLAGPPRRSAPPGVPHRRRWPPRPVKSKVSRAPPMEQQARHHTPHSGQRIHRRHPTMLTFQQIILTLQSYWGQARLRPAPALRHGGRRWHQPHRHLPACTRP